MKIAVVILNWNGIKYLRKFLPLVVANSPGATVFIADNASTDESLPFVREYFPNVQIIVNSSNHGFAKGYNDALKQIQSEYYVLLNSDVEVSPNWLEQPVKMLDENRDVAAIQPKILSYGDRNHFEYAGAAGGFIDKYAYPFCRGRMFDLVEEDHAQYNDVTEVFWVSGAAMCIRSEVFHQAGGFDEEFFAHMEEIDLCWRIQNRGYRLLYCPDSTVFHVGGGTLNKSNPYKTFLNFRNNLLMLYKNTEPSKLAFVFLCRLFLDGLAGLRFLLQGNFADCWAIVRAHFYFYANYGKQKSKRIIEKEYMSKNKHILKNIYPNNIVLKFFVAGKKTFSSLHWNR